MVSQRSFEDVGHARAAEPSFEAGQTPVTSAMPDLLDGRILRMRPSVHADGAAKGDSAVAQDSHHAILFAKSEDRIQE